MNAAPSSSGTRKSRNFANIDSITPMRSARADTLTTYTTMPTATFAGVTLVAMPHGAKTLAITLRNTSNLIPAAHSSQSQISPRVLKQHRFMDHRQFEMRGGIIHRDATRLRQGNDEERY